MLAAALGRRLIRLQCYEGLDVAERGLRVELTRAQMIEIRLAEAAGARRPRARWTDELFSERFLIRRPLLQAMRARRRRGPPVLLIDELDRADEPFEAFLLEVLVRLPDHDPRARHDQGRASRRSSSSPRTARARSTTR